MIHLMIATLLFVTSIGVGATLADDRIALLIGNKSYSKSVGPLANPHNDVHLVADALNRIGFERSNIHILYDQGRAQIRRAVREHARRVDSAGSNAIGFFYYSGHGAADLDTRTNYLIPIDVTSRGEEIWDDSVPLSYIVNRLQKKSGSAAHFVIFDACRDELQLIGRKTTEKGFVPEAARPGMLIAYATDQGRTASDVGERSGPYASALVAELAKPGRPAGALFDAIKFRVYQQTSRPKQLPWHVSKFTRPIILNYRNARYSASQDTKTSKPVDVRPVHSGENVVSGSTIKPNSSARKFSAEQAFKIAQSIGNCSAYDFFLNEYPQGFFANMAKSWKQQNCPPRKQIAARKSHTLKNSSRNQDAETETVASTLPGDFRQMSDVAHPQLIRELQRKLKSLGCYRGRIDGDWGSASQRAAARAIGASVRSQQPTMGLLEKLRKSTGKRCKLSEIVTSRRRTKPTVQKRDVIRKRKGSVITSKSTGPSRQNLSNECRAWRSCSVVHGGARRLFHCGYPPARCASASALFGQ